MHILVYNQIDCSEENQYGPRIFRVAYLRKSKFLVLIQALKESCILFHKNSESAPPTFQVKIRFTNATNFSVMSKSIVHFQAITVKYNDWKWMRNKILEIFFTNQAVLKDDIKTLWLELSLSI